MTMLWLLILGFVHCVVAFSQEDVDYMANNLQIHYLVLDNLKEAENFTSRIILTNKGTKRMERGPWSIYLNSIRMIEPNYLTNNPSGHILQKYGVKLVHISGSLFKIQPVEGFKTILPGKSLEITFHSQYFSAARTDVMPNFYIASNGLTAKNIQSTNESLAFVGKFDTKEKWKRYKSDLYNPFTTHQRFEKNTAVNKANIGVSIIPTPVEMTVENNPVVNIKDWIIVTSKLFQNEADYLGEKLKLKVNTSAGNILSKTIQFIQENVTIKLNDLVVDNEEAYILNVSNDRVTIKAEKPSGAFYAVQSLLTIVNLDNTQIPQVLIKDAPRYGYRGMMLDIARNFHGKDSILKIMDAMAMYKMNKLHLHMSDDEGWRLEIPGLEELTSFGGKRCHDIKMCITPQLGSGATTSTSGTGYLTIKEYKEILKYGKKYHIEVIPEFDMPGHSHAAIKAMEHRHWKYNYNSTNNTVHKNVSKFLLNEPGDISRYLSIQMFRDNAVNPCFNSTYNFIEHLITSLIDIHKNILPLKIFHIGGDEVANGAWVNSSACQKLISQNPKIASVKGLKKYFFASVSNITNKYNLYLAAWEDGIMEGNKPFDLAEMSDKNMLSYAWDNVWEWGKFNRAYLLANAGYKNVMCQATHLYFDMPYEPNPEEPGYYWATRYTDTRKTFGFMPDKLYDNAKEYLNGKVTSKEELCKKPDACPALSKSTNIIGMQAHLWSETVRTEDQLFYMIFPRMLAIAERAWHKASFEREDTTVERDSMNNIEWETFANILGHKELNRLDEMGIKYRVPPPGAKEMEGKLTANVVFPGLKIEYRTENDPEWKEYKAGLAWVGKLKLRTKSADEKRRSTEITLNISPGPSAKSCGCFFSPFLLILVSVCGLYTVM